MQNLDEMQMNKNNGVQMVGVQVRLQEENVCPVVLCRAFFNEIRLGEPVEKVMNEIAKCMEEAGNAPFVYSGINPMDYDSVKEHLAVMLVNTQANKRMLQEMPHENIEDLSAICYVDFPGESNDGKATMKVKNEHLKMWNGCKGNVPAGKSKYTACKYTDSSVNGRNVAEYF